jgi:hypothetical protein
MDQIDSQPCLIEGPKILVEVLVEPEWLRAARSMTAFDKPHPADQDYCR